MLFADGFDAALIGVAEPWRPLGRGATRPFVAVYDRLKCIEILARRDGMDEDTAAEYFSFNVEGAFVGEHTPIFVTLLKPKRMRT